MHCPIPLGVRCSRFRGTLLFLGWLILWFHPSEGEMPLIGPISLWGVLIVWQMLSMRIGVLNLKWFCLVIWIFCTSCWVKVLLCLQPCLFCCMGWESPLTKTLVYHDQDGIEVVNWWEICDEVHRTIGKWSHGGGAFCWNKRGFQWLSVKFELLTCATSFVVIVTG